MKKYFVSNRKGPKHSDHDGLVLVQGEQTTPFNDNNSAWKTNISNNNTMTTTATIATTDSNSTASATISSKAAPNGTVVVHYDTSQDDWRTDRNSHFDPRIAYITFCHLNGTSRFEEMVLSSLETWMQEPPTDQYYVVIADMWKEQYDAWIGHNKTWSDRIEPLFVDCPEGKYGLPACCKMEKGLLSFMERGLLARYDWVFYTDDDVYVRKVYLREYTATLIHVNKPLVLAGGIVQPLGSRFNKCRQHDRFFKYRWGQPVMYSRGALRKMRRGLELGGLVKQCVEYDITHDLGNALLNWMYSFEALWMRTRDRPDKIKPWDLVIHGVGRCGQGGEETTRAEGESCDMHEIHKRAQQVRNPNRSEYEYQWHSVKGFRSTPTYKQHGDPKKWKTEWHTMPVAECKTWKKFKAQLNQTNTTTMPTL